MRFRLLSAALLLAWSGRVAEAAIAVPPALAVGAATICEFPHPPLVVQFHPSAQAPFTLADIDSALSEGATAVELDLRLRPDDQAVVCSHQREDLAGRPTLRESIDRVLTFQGDSPTVRRDSLQFFLVLDFKENSGALYDGAVSVLRAYAERWSTGGGIERKPRGITVVVSGERAGLARHIPAATLDSLCVIEGTDYQWRMVDRSPSPGRTFQWIAIQHPGERGRVQALHLGTDVAVRGVFNVRAYDCGVIESCVASGVDAVNAGHGQIARGRALAAARSARPATSP